MPCIGKQLPHQTQPAGPQTTSIPHCRKCPAHQQGSLQCDARPCRLPGLVSSCKCELQLCKPFVWHSFQQGIMWAFVNFRVPWHELMGFNRRWHEARSSAGPAVTLFAADQHYSDLLLNFCEHCLCLWQCYARTMYPLVTLHLYGDCQIMLKCCIFIFSEKFGLWVWCRCCLGAYWV